MLTFVHCNKRNFEIYWNCRETLLFILSKNLLWAAAPYINTSSPLQLVQVYTQSCELICSVLVQHFWSCVHWWITNVFQVYVLLCVLHTRVYKQWMLCVLIVFHQSITCIQETAVTHKKSVKYVPSRHKWKNASNIKKRHYKTAKKQSCWQKKDRSISRSEWVNVKM